jgi:hypothetical protein
MRFPFGADPSSLRPMRRLAPDRLLRRIPRDRVIVTLAVLLGVDSCCGSSSCSCGGRRSTPLSPCPPICGSRRRSRRRGDQPSAGSPRRSMSAWSSWRSGSKRRASDGRTFRAAVGEIVALVRDRRFRDCYQIATRQPRDLAGISSVDAAFRDGRYWLERCEPNSVYGVNALMLRPSRVRDGARLWPDRRRRPS